MYNLNDLNERDVYLWMRSKIKKIYIGTVVNFDRGNRGNVIRILVDDKIKEGQGVDARLCDQNLEYGYLSDQMINHIIHFQHPHGRLGAVLEARQLLYNDGYIVMHNANAVSLDLIFDRSDLDIGFRAFAYTKQKELEHIIRMLSGTVLKQKEQ